ncbi:MAG: xanthine dehydrogenase family protein molybdopterin-binding subunit [Nitrososphaerota archaeon]
MVVKQQEVTSYIGQNIKRKHDIKFVTGKAVYINDISFPQMLYCVYLGSPYAHAKIKKIDVSEALKVKGVKMVLTGEDCVKYLNPLPVTIDYSKPPFNFHWRTVKAYPIAIDKVRFVGEPVAAVIAEDPYIAEDALALIKVEYEPLPPVTSIEEAMRKDAPLLYEEWGDNIQSHFTIKGGNVEEAFKEADKIIKFKYREKRHSGFPIEPRGCVSVYDTKTGTLTHYSNTQAPLLARQYIASVLRIPESNVRVISADVGGGFGNKLNWGKEIIPALASKLTGRPVKWFESRRENFLTQPHNRDYVWEAELAVKTDGRIIGYRARLFVDVGVEGTNRGSGCGCGLVGALYSAGPLKHLKGAEIEVFNIVTNKSFFCAYRGYGKDFGARFYGRAFYFVSRELKIPVEEVIRRNVLQPEDYPYKTILGPHYDSANFPALLDKAMKKYSEFLEKKKKLISEGKLAGVGITAWVEPSGAAVPYCIYYGIETARIAVYPEGNVKVYTSITDIGQGSESTFAQVAAEVLGVNMDEIVVIEGDSDITGAGPWSSRGATYGISALVKAARILKERILKTVANIWNVKPEELEIRNSEVYMKSDPSKRISIYEVARQVYFWPGARFVMPPDLLEKGETTLDVTISWFSPLTAKDPFAVYTTHVTGVDVALISIDPHTYTINVVDYYMVHDCGKIINPAIVEAQLYGGIAQGIGAALYEELIYDENGQLLNPTYMDYLIPTAVEIPSIQIDHVESPSPFTELGTKGMGEGGPISAPSAIIGAIEDALADYGIVITEAPVTPSMLLKLIKEKKK